MDVLVITGRDVPAGQIETPCYVQTGIQGPVV